MDSNTYKITDAVVPSVQDINIGDMIQLTNQTQPVYACEQTAVKMLNIDADQLAKGDLKYIKKLGLTISNPDTDKPIALGVDYKPESFGHRLSNWFSGAAAGAGIASSYDDDSDDDSSFFSSGGSFGGGSSWGGFGGFGGGSFSGGGASASF